MSDIMDSAVLNMPFKMAMSDELSQMQFFMRAQSVLRERDSLKAQIVELEMIILELETDIIMMKEEDK